MMPGDVKAAREVAEEQIWYWRERSWSPYMACQALGLRSHYTWDEVRDYMTRWWLRNHDAA